MSQDSEQPLISHLLELRNRLLRIVLVIVVLFIGLAFVANELYLWLSKPLIEQLPYGSSLIATDVTSPLFAPFKLAFVAAFFYCHALCAASNLDVHFTRALSA